MLVVATTSQFLRMGAPYQDLRVEGPSREVLLHGGRSSPRYLWRTGVEKCSPHPRTSTHPSPPKLDYVLVFCIVTLPLCWVAC
jgi:hypothetical protein